eukprot:3941989-Rhodomonas_salina.7
MLLPGKGVKFAKDAAKLLTEIDSHKVAISLRARYAMSGTALRGSSVRYAVLAYPPVRNQTHETTLLVQTVLNR